jgi:dTDP-4-dehydrorhamnose reductase
MNILLFGKNGQVGGELQRALAPLGTVTSLSTDSTDYSADFTHTEGVLATIRAIKPDVIVNAAAYTAVDRAESEAEHAHLINASTVEAIAKEAGRTGAWLVHYSTDYVFAGSGDHPWTEDDIPAPLNVYGHSKLAGELAIQKYCANHLIFRTSWVYADRGNNFATTMMRLAVSRSQLSVINDQYGAPTGADLLADCTAHALLQAMKQPELAGLYHLTAAGVTTWYDYACLVFAQAHQAGVELILRSPDAVPTSAYPTAARRPLNSRMNNAKFQHTFGITLPDWQVGVIRMLSTINARDNSSKAAQAAENKSR